MQTIDQILADIRRVVGEGRAPSQIIPDGGSVICPLVMMDSATPADLKAELKRMEDRRAGAAAGRKLAISLRSKALFGGVR